MVMVFVGVVLLPATAAVHEYRGPSGGCTPAVGEISDSAPNGPVVTTVLMLHNTFNDLSTGLPLTVVHVGDAVRWTWNSEHCHSIQSASFYSGFHYPEPEPTTPPLLPGLFHYPVPTLSATLAYTHTFAQTGTFMYACEHHGVIGMQGVVLVLA
jgi:plastocyanin